MRFSQSSAFPTQTVPLLIAFAIIGACGGGQNGSTAPAAPTLPEPTSAAVVLDSQLQMAEAGNAEAFTAFFSDDTFSFGPLAGDTNTSVSGARETFARALAALSPQTAVSTSRELHPISDSCAWAFDQVTITTNTQRERKFFVTSLLESNAGRWQIAAQSWSMPVQPTYILYLANRGGWPEIAAPSESAETGTEAARDVIRGWLENKEFPALSGRNDSIVIAAWPNDERRGDEEVTDALDQIRRDSSFLISPIGGAHARLACGGQMAYVAFGQRIELQSQNGPSVVVPTRGMSFFVNEGSGLRPLVVQVSLGFANYPE